MLTAPRVWVTCDPWRSSGVQIPRDMCTRFGRYLYSTKCSWIMKDQTTLIDCACFIAVTLLELQVGCERIPVILVPNLALVESARMLKILKGHHKTQKR